MQETERSRRMSYIHKKEQVAIFKRSNLNSGKLKKELPLPSDCQKEQIKIKNIQLNFKYF